MARPPATQKYRAEVFGSAWSRGPTLRTDTITAARAWAEEYGTTADRCVITDRAGNVVAEHRRDPNGDGTRWFKASV